MRCLATEVSTVPVSARSVAETASNRVSLVGVKTDTHLAGMNGVEAVAGEASILVTETCVPAGMAILDFVSSVARVAGLPASGTPLTTTVPDLILPRGKLEHPCAAKHIAISAGASFINHPRSIPGLLCIAPDVHNVSSVARHHFCPVLGIPQYSHSPGPQGGYFFR
jgi:hypothetical protein